MRVHNRDRVEKKRRGGEGGVTLDSPRRQVPRIFLPSATSGIVDCIRLLLRRPSIAYEYVLRFLNQEIEIDR